MPAPIAPAWREFARRQAAEWFERGCQLDSDRSTCAAAIVAYQRALALAPTLPDTHVSLALLYERLGLPRKALGCWRRYLQLAPNGARAEIARGHL